VVACQKHVWLPHDHTRIQYSQRCGILSEGDVGGLQGVKFASLDRGESAGHAEKR